MTYVKIEDEVEKYQGTSFSRTLHKGDGSEWTSDETANFVVTDKSANVVASGDLTKDGSNTQISFMLGDTETVKFIGEYLLLVHLIDASEPEVNVILAEYHLTFLNKKAV